MPRRDKLLAAPDSLRGAEERRKYTARKARLQAEKLRLTAQKLKKRPSVEDLLADVIRVAEDRETNPFWKFRSISRRRYELYGHFPVDFLDQQFGTFAHAKQVAGLEDQPGDRLWRTRRADTSRKEHAGRYVTRHITPYVAGAEATRKLTDAYLMLSISDTHATFLDPFTWACFLRAIKDLRPDGVLFNGDILEGSEISRHPKIPGWTLPLQLELDFQREMTRQVRESAAHGGDIWVTGGNHGVDRLASYFTQVSPALANLRSLRIDQLLGLDDYKVKLLLGGTIASPQGTEDQKSGFLLFGNYRVHHGTKLGQHPAHSELRAAGRSGQSGHVHRAQVAYGTSEADAGMSWMCTPCACTGHAAKSYIKGTTDGWQRGFGIAWIFPDGRVHQYPVITDGEWCHVEGYQYRRGKIPDSMEPTKLWLPEAEKWL